MAASKKNEVIEIPAMNLKMLTLSIKGTSPLIVHAWSHKAKQMMLDKQMKKATKGKDARDPAREEAEAKERAKKKAAFRAAMMKRNTK